MPHCKLYLNLISVLIAKVNTTINYNSFQYIKLIDDLICFQQYFSYIFYVIVYYK